MVVEFRVVRFYAFEQEVCGLGEEGVDGEG